MKTNHWSQIRNFARETRQKLLKATGGNSAPDVLLERIAYETGIHAYGLAADDPLLYKAQAILHNNIVFFDDTLEKWQTYFNQMHEYAHHFLKHGSAIICGNSDFDPEASEDAVAFGEQRVEGYGPHERRELGANLFSREFFLPCDELRSCFLADENADSIAARFDMPSGMVIHQLMRAVLGVEAENLHQEISDTETNERFDLDKDQQNAAHSGKDAFISGAFELPVLVDAGPGTGKTRTLTARIAHLINDRKISPGNILALTYSNKAAEEMYSRVSAATSQNASKIWMGTFHRFCLELIRKYHYLLGVSAKPLVADAYDVQLLLEKSLDRLKLKHYRSLARPGTNFKRILGSISRAKDELITPEQYETYAQSDLNNSLKNKQKRIKAEKDLEIANAYRVYQEVLRENNFLDYGDLLFLAVDLLRKNDALREEIQQKYQHILIGNSRAQALATTGGRELQAQTSGCRSNPGQTDAAGRVEKKVLRTRERRQLVKKLIDEYRVSIKKAAALCLLARSLVYYKAHGRDDRAVRQRIKEIAETRVRYGMARIHILLRREGWSDNHKRVRRIYREEGLNLRLRRPRRSRAARHRGELIQLTAPNQCWSMDFVMDALFDGRRFRALTVVDNYSRECLEIEVGQSLKGEDVVRVMERIKLVKGAIPGRIKVDNGSEFISKALDLWASENGVVLDFSRPGKPTDNAFIESFNGSFRDECLNVNWFLSLEDAREKITAFKQEYNHFRPHSALGNLTPVEALSRHRRSPETLL